MARHLLLIIGTIFLVFENSNAGGVLSKLNATSLSEANSCEQTSLIIIVDTASFIKQNRLVPIRQLMQSLGLSIYDKEGSIFALVDASRVAAGDVIVSNDQTQINKNASVRYFAAREADQEALRDSWPDAVDDFWLYASLSSHSLRRELNFETLESIIDSTSKRLVRRHRITADQQIDEATTTTTSTTASPGNGTSENSTETNKKPKSLVVLTLLNYSPEYRDPKVTPIKNRRFDFFSFEQEDDTETEDWESKLVPQNDQEDHQETGAPVRKVVACLDCPVSDCNSQPNFRRLRNLVGGSRLDVICLPASNNNQQEQSRHHLSLLVYNLERSVCDLSNNDCRLILEHDIERQHGTVPQSGLPLDFTGSLIETRTLAVKFPWCTYYAKCDLRAGYGTDHLYQEIVRCPAGQFYSEVTSSCLSHSEGKAPCQPNICATTNQGNIAKRMAASAAVDAAASLAAASQTNKLSQLLAGGLDAHKLLLLMHINRTVQQTCIPLATESGNCRAFATCHPDTDQTLLHCCPPGRTLLAGTCSCVAAPLASEGIHQCPITTRCSPNEGNDMTWAEMYVTEHQQINQQGSTSNFNHPPWFLSLPPGNKPVVRLRSSSILASQEITLQQTNAFDILARRRSNVQRRNRKMMVIPSKQKRGYPESTETPVAPHHVSETILRAPVEEEEPEIGEYCLNPVSGQRRRGPTPKKDASNVFYIFDWVTSDWQPQTCHTEGHVFLVNTCSCNYPTS